MNRSAFSSAKPAPPEIPAGLAYLPEDAQRDKDRLIVPPRWHTGKGRENWEAQPLGWRKIREAEYLEELVRDASKAERPRRPGATRFTTDAAVKWGRRQGWQLIERERFDFRTKRHHDLELGVDAMFDDGKDGRVGVQGAGRSERKEHYERFLARGGPEKAQRRGVRVVYVEFERGNPDPIKEEWWS